MIGCGFVLIDRLLTHLMFSLGNILCANFRISGRVFYVII